MNGIDLSLIVERATQWINDPAKQFITDAYIHDASRAPYFVARAQQFIVAKHNDADLILIHIEGDTEFSIGKGKQFFGARARQS